MAEAESQDKAAKEPTFGTTKDYLIATAAGLAAGPFFLISPMVMLIIDKGKASKDYSAKKKWKSWKIAGAIIVPTMWGLLGFLGTLDQKTGEINQAIASIKSSPVTATNYKSKNQEVVSLLKEYCYAKDEKDCLNLDNTKTWLTESQKQEVNQVLTVINSERAAEKKRLADAEFERKLEEEAKKQQAIADGSYIPDEFEVGRPCKKLAEELSTTGRIDWGFLGNAKSRYSPGTKTILMEGRTKNAFGVKIPFKIACQWQPGGIVKVINVWQ